MQESTENSDKEIKTIKMFQTEITELVNTITEMKHSVEGFNGRLYQADERIYELKDRSLEPVILSEEQGEK